MAGDDREQQFERAMARLLRDASPESHCPDAEILAAYHERTLPAEQMVLWKEHISACVLCQEVLALVEKSEDVPVEEWQEQEKEKELGVAAYEAIAPATLRATAPEFAEQEAPDKSSAAPIPASIHAATSRTRWRWIVPVGALAAGVIAWVGVREINTQHKQEALSVQIARNQKTIPALPMPPAPAERVQLQPEKQQPALPSAEISRDKAKKSAPSIAARPLQQPSGAQDFSSATQPAAAARTLATPGVAGNDSKVAAPSPSVLAGSLDSRARGQIERGAQVQPPPPPASEPKPKVQNQAAQIQSSSQAVTVQVAPVAPDNALVQTETPATAKMNLVSVAAADHRLILAPSMKRSWRVGDSGKIEYSSDLGKTWKPQGSSVTADLTAGSATSDKVCWVVGKNGTILRTTDGGKHWNSITSPISGDLGGIHAIDAQHASIWDVPNRTSFETADGGVTWTRSANE